MRRTLMAITLFLTLTAVPALAEDAWTPRPPEPTASWYSSFDWVWDGLSFLF